MIENKYTTETHEYKIVYKYTDDGNMVKVGEILTLGNNTKDTNTTSSFDKIPNNSAMQSHADSELPTYGLILHHNSNMPCGRYTRVEYTPEQLEYFNNFTKQYLGTQLLDIFASNTNCLIVVLETPSKQSHEPEFMVLIRPDMYQSNITIYWKNHPISPWYADRCAETDDVLIARKFPGLGYLNRLFDDIYRCLDRANFKIVHS